MKTLCPGLIPNLTALWTVFLLENGLKLPPAIYVSLRQKDSWENAILLIFNILANIYCLRECDRGWEGAGANKVDKENIPRV